MYIGLISLWTLLATTVAEGNEITYTAEELKYIAEHPIVTIAIDADFIPYEFIDSDGKYKGISADYLKLIEIHSGLSFEHIPTETWSEAYNMGLKGQVNLLPIIGITDLRESQFLISDSYMSFQRVLISNANTTVHNFSDLESYEVGVLRNSTHYDFVSENYNIEPVKFEHIEDMLSAISANSIEVAIANSGTANYYIKRLGLTSIKIDDTHAETNTKLGMAITNDNEMLRSILNKSLSDITSEERSIIMNKWLGVDIEANYTPYKVAVGIALLVIISIMVWSYLLKKEINQRKSLQRDLNSAKNEAEKANQAKSVFLAHMSHEIRTPLNAISGLTYLLENTQTSTVQNGYINSLNDASENLLNVITDILDFSKIEAGETETEEIIFSIDDVLRKVSSIVRHKVTEKGLSFHIRRSTNVSNDVIGDPTKIQQVLINLINNAAKFTQKGTILVDIHEITDHDKYNVKLMVKDTGIGISHEKINQLFIPFHQLDASITREYGGTGLGLSITKNLVTLMGGEITVVSIEGIGSEFIVKLPLKAISNRETLMNPLSIMHKVLLIEDDSTTSGIIYEYLNDQQMDVDIIDSLEHYQSDAGIGYDVIMISYDMNPDEVVRISKELIAIDKNVVFLVDTMNELIHQCATEIGIDQVLVKPVLASSLYKAMDDLSPKIMSNSKSDDDDFGKGHVILLVDDNQINLAIAEEILQQKSYTVITASNGEEAVEIIKKSSQIELVLMDINMPIMDGYEAAERIRSIGIHKPIIAMTAVSINTIKDKCTEAGMNGFVTKPFNPEELFETIQLNLGMYDGTQNLTEGFTLDSMLQVKPNNSYVDYKAGIQRIGNNEKRYYEILELYLKDISGADVALTKAIDEKNYVVAATIVHKVKGCTGNIGGVALFQSSKILEEVLHSDIEMNVAPYLLEYEHDLMGTVEEVTHKIEEKNRLIQKTENQRSSTCNASDEDLYNLLDLLEKSDLDAMAKASALDHSFKDEPLWYEMKDAMASYDYQKAYLVLRKIVLSL